MGRCDIELLQVDNEYSADAVELLNDDQMGECDIELLQLNNTYLKDTIVCLENAKNKYSITLFGHIIDKALVTKLLISLLGSAGSAIFGLIVKKISSDLHK
ncbi:unnamed protein product [Didymodactylos carnosus]|nr:unnamed protein product [Didymodactylos carnosus]CAF4458527.1 unnamed protein product [Didymodactylos carnosus]